MVHYTLDDFASYNIHESCGFFLYINVICMKTYAIRHFLSVFDLLFCAIQTCSVKVLLNSNVCLQKLEI